MGATIAASPLKEAARFKRIPEVSDGPKMAA